MKRILWAVLLVVCLLAVARVWNQRKDGDELAAYINAQWPTISVEEQRQQATASAARALSKVATPDLALGASLTNLQRVLNSPSLRAMGIIAVSVRGEEQLLRIEARFSRRFDEASAEATPEAVALLRTLSPLVVGTIVVYAGVSSEVLASAGDATEIRIKLLPALKAVAVERVTAAQREGLEIGAVLTDAVNRYADAVLTELARVPVVSVSILAKPPAACCLVTDRCLLAMAQLKGADAAIESPAPTYPAFRARFERLLASRFERRPPVTSTWLGLRKDLVAASDLSSALRVGGVAVSGRIQRDAAAVFVIQPPNRDD